MTFHFPPAAGPLLGIPFDCNAKQTFLSPEESPERGCRSRARTWRHSDHIWREWELVALRKINSVCLCKWPYLYHFDEEGPNVLQWRKWVNMHVGADPALCGWHKPRHCFVERHLGVFRAAAMLSTGFLELSAFQAVLKWAGWSSSTDRKGILLWHTVPLQWELALGKDPPWCWIDPWEQLIQNHNVLVQHLAAEWLVDQPWHYLFFYYCICYSLSISDG